jgi:hypothetical protein
VTVENGSLLGKCPLFEVDDTVRDYFNIYIILSVDFGPDIDLWAYNVLYPI